MKWLLVLVAGLALGCRAKPAPVDAQPAPSIAPGPAAPRVFGTWTQDDGVEWRAVIVPVGTTSGELHFIARQLHQGAPLVFFDLYDDDAELSKLIAAHGDDDALPDAWRKAHAVGSIAGSVKTIDGGVVVGAFQLFDWRTGKAVPLN